MPCRALPDTHSHHLRPPASPPSRRRSCTSPVPLVLPCRSLSHGCSAPSTQPAPPLPVSHCWPARGRSPLSRCLRGVSPCWAARGSCCSVWWAGCAGAAATAVGQVGRGQVSAVLMLMPHNPVLLEQPLSDPIS